jgi:hypothetical protein
MVQRQVWPNIMARQNGRTNYDDGEQSNHYGARSCFFFQPNTPGIADGALLNFCHDGCLVMLGQEIADFSQPASAKMNYCKKWPAKLTARKTVMRANNAITTERKLGSMI